MLDLYQFQEAVFWARLDSCHWNIHSCIKYQYHWKPPSAWDFYKNKKNISDVGDLSISSAWECKCAGDESDSVTCECEFDANCFVSVSREPESSQSVRVWDEKLLKAMKRAHDLVQKLEVHLYDSYRPRIGRSAKYRPVLVGGPQSKQRAPWNDIILVDNLIVKFPLLQLSRELPGRVHSLISRDSTVLQANAGCQSTTGNENGARGGKAMSLFGLLQTVVIQNQ